MQGTDDIVLVIECCNTFYMDLLTHQLYNNAQQVSVVHLYFFIFYVELNHLRVAFLKAYTQMLHYVY